MPHRNPFIYGITNQSEGQQCPIFANARDFVHFVFGALAELDREARRAPPPWAHRGPATLAFWF